MQETEINWQDPPRSAQWNRHHWDPFVEQLRKRPGKWAVASEGAGYNAVNGPFQTLRMHGCETMRRTVDGAVVLYARWPEDAS